MIKNLLLVALRNFKRDRWYSLLNILGLTIGITFSIFLIFYVKDELSYDRYNKKADRIYRITSFIKEPEKETMKWTATQFPLGPALQKEFPEVEAAVRFVGVDKTMYKRGELRSYEDKAFYADSTLFNIFTYDFLEGNPRNALVEPKSMVLTESLAKKYFGKTTGVVGQSLQNAGGDVFKITAVIGDVPSNSHIRFNLLISASTLAKDFANHWGAFGFYTYVLLRPNADPAAFEKKLLPLYDKYMAAIFKQFNIKIHYGVQPITAIHLHSDFQGEPEELGSISYVYIFSAVALFMIIIACINYMNLTTARSARRAKEIGIRKVTGSTKPQLVVQFLVESTLTTIVALLLSMGLVALLLPTFNALSGKSIGFHALIEPGSILILLGIVLIVGLLGGSYPALYLSSFNPIDILKGSLAKGSSNVALRRVLVVTQFSIAMIMLICTWVVYGQLNYLEKKDLGFDKQEVLSIAANSNKDIRGQIGNLKNELRKNPQVLSVSSAQAVPGQGINFNLWSMPTDKGYTDKGVDNYGIDEDYFKTLGMQIKKGRAFNGLNDTLRSVIVNENLVKYFGWSNPLGKRIKRAADTSAFYLEVVGVVKDFNQKSLYNPITPLMLFYRPNASNIQVKISAKDVPASIASVERTWKAIFPELPFEYTFLDRDFSSQYAADQKRGKIFTAFSILTILITCLGLLGLIAFTTEQRQKEISIRKIMGAGIGQIISLMTANFVLLVGISCFIAFPVAWIFMSNWLKIFPYNTGLTVMPFLLSALAVLAITLLTVIFHTVKVAVANPAKGLRTE
jgi:putative ABC transport system permease protein